MHFRRKNLRIIGGKFKGRRLQPPRGATIRPTADRVREAIFNILGGACRQRLVVDIFAGTGALGLEAISRGAQRAIFIDNQRSAIEVIRRNIVACGCQLQAQAVRHDVARNLNCLKGVDVPAELVFMDAPYRQGLIGPALGHLSAGRFLAVDASIVIEHARDEALPDLDVVFQLSDQRRYGKTLVSFLNYVL